MRTEDNRPHGRFFYGKNMAKNATVWKPIEGQGDVTTENDGSYLKINATDYLLLGAGSTDRLLLGATVVEPKNTTVWSSE